MSNRPSEYDAEDGRRRDEKAWKEWHEVNYPSEDPLKIEREAHFALQDRMFFKSEQPRVRALQDAIEGELDGLGISNEKAEAILRHIDKEAPGKPRAWAVFAENRNLRIWSTDGEGIRKYAEQHNLPLTPLYDHPVGSPLAYRTTQVCHRCMSPDGRHWDGRECWLCKHYPLSKQLDVEGLARQSDCAHVDLNGDRAKSLERLSDFAAFVRSATCSISDKEIERIAGRDELTGDAILRFARDLLAFASGERVETVCAR